VKGLDTNVLVRYLVADDAKQVARATRFIERECTQENPCFLNRIVVCELVWVLRGVYGYTRDEILVPLKMLLRTAEFRLEDQNAAWTAVGLYEGGKCDFADGYLARTNRCADCEATATFGRKAAHLEDFEKL
jgi:predicted nucleic-acid-binding protein